MGTEKAGGAARPPLVATPGHRRALPRAPARLSAGSGSLQRGARRSPGPRPAPALFLPLRFNLHKPVHPLVGPNTCRAERWTPRGHTCLPSWGAELFIGSAGVLKSRGSVTNELSQVKDASFKTLLSACRCARQREMSPCSQGQPGVAAPGGPSNQRPGDPLVHLVGQHTWSPTLSETLVTQLSGTLWTGEVGPQGTGGEAAVANPRGAHHPVPRDKQLRGRGKGVVRVLV